MPSYCDNTSDNEYLQEVRETRFLLNRVDQWILDEMQPYLGHRILEVGCGRGNLVRSLAPNSELVVGIDNDEETIRFVEQSTQQSGLGIQAYCLDICGAQVLELAECQFDTVVSLNVIEHIEDDVLALRQMRKLLSPGGYLVLVVPAHAFLYGTIDRSIGHYRRYDGSKLNEKLAAAGFTPLFQRYLNLIGALGWFVGGTILRSRTPSVDQLRACNGLVPFIRCLETRIRPPFGTSLFTIAK